MTAAVHLSGGLLCKKRGFPMRDYQKEFENRVSFIRSVLAESGADGIVYGNSGGKDSALVGILCKAACDNTIGIIMPCASKRNYDQDTADELNKTIANKIETMHAEHPDMGYRRLRDALAHDENIHVNEKRVLRIGTTGIKVRCLRGYLLLFLMCLC